MRIAVTDACIFIDLYYLQLTNQFFSLKLEIHTSLEVFNELNNHQKQLLSAFQTTGKLTIHNITSSEQLDILKKDYPKSLSTTDRTVLFIAEKLGAILLSSDKPVRVFAKRNSIEYHGMLWIFDQLLAIGAISPSLAIEKLKTLINTNIVYQNNAELVAEMQKRLNAWSKL